MTGRNKIKSATAAAKSSNSCSFDLKSAIQKDFAFCLKLYVSSMEQHLSALNAWNREKAEATFESYFKTEEIRIILVGGNHVGWIQVSETAKAINLDQIHLYEEYQNRGIGSRLIMETMAIATDKKKPVLLSLIRGNRAMNLYQRMGFRPDGEDLTKFHMRWDG